MRPPVRVTVLTRVGCHPCEQAEEILRRLAVEYPLTIETLDFTAPIGQALARAAGMRFPPGIFFDWQPIAFGRPSERRLRRELDRRLGRSPLA